MFYIYFNNRKFGKANPVIVATCNESTTSDIFLFCPLCPSSPRKKRTPSPIQQR